MHAFALAPALLLATPTVEGARATLNDGRLAVDVAISEPILREEVRSKLEADRLSIYIEGAEASGRRSYGRAPLAMTVLPRAAYTKVELPLAADMGCAGPVALRVTDTGVRATLPCQAKPAAAAPPAAEAKAETKAETKAGATTAAKGTPAPAPTPVAAPAPAPAAAPIAPVAAPIAPTAVAPVPAAPVVAPAAPAFAPADPGKAPGPLSARAPMAGVSPLPMMAMLAMVALAVFLMWRKRKQHKTGLIQIIETASLGPKRSLIVAEINGERMILGASEAGITLLNQVRPGGYDPNAFPMSERTLASAPVAAIARAAEAAAAARPAPVAAEIPEGEGGLLARLFKRRQAEHDDLDVSEDGPSTMAHDFADLLNDSLEDEELRRRLQSGMTARAPGRTS
jgi:flagellar protein FliO/FliZ